MALNHPVIWLASGTLAGVTATANAQNQQNSIDPKLKAPAITALSQVTQGQINGWVTKVQTIKPNFAPSNDPDYSEFWIEMRPATPNDKVLPAFSSVAPFSAKLLPNTLAAGTVLKKTLQPKDLSNYVNKKMSGFDPTLANWSEEAWGEITPTFAEIAGPDDEYMKKGKIANGNLTIRALDNGKPVPPEYYKDILKNVKAASQSK